MIRYRNRQLFVEDLPVQTIADSVGTPVYVYSKRELLSNYDDYRQAFRNIPNLICYALKANSNLTLLKLLAEQGSGADIVSGGELYRALKAGFPPARIVFAGVGKTPEEIECAIRKGILAIHVESEDELFHIDSIARRVGRTARISLRINPNIKARTHPYISTGLKRHKFGIPIGQAFELYQKAATLEHLSVDGIHMHLGSHISDIKPFEEGVRRLLSLIDRLSDVGIPLKHLDIGGGLAARDQPRDRTSKQKALASLIAPLLKGRKLQLILEPGRSIVATAGILLTRVLYTKENQGKKFVIVDAGMNDFIRPALYGAFHRILPGRRSNRPVSRQDVVGPVCESADFFAKDRELQAFVPGELLAIDEAGAYGFSMSSNYNSRPRAAEVLVDGEKIVVIRRRESHKDLIKGEM